MFILNTILTVLIKGLNWYPTVYSILVRFSLRQCFPYLFQTTGGRRPSSRCGVQKRTQNSTSGSKQIYFHICCLCQSCPSLVLKLATFPQKCDTLLIVIVILVKWTQLAKKHVATRARVLICSTNPHVPQHLGAWTKGGRRPVASWQKPSPRFRQRFAGLCWWYCERAKGS